MGVVSYLVGGRTAGRRHSVRDREGRFHREAEMASIPAASPLNATCPGPPLVSREVIQPGGNRGEWLAGPATSPAVVCGRPRPNFPRPVASGAIPPRLGGGWRA